MKRKMILATLAVLGCTAVSTGINPAQASQVYELDGIEVNADADKTVDQFGNVVTSQSYYRTGGDVDVIDSATIEKRHYQQVGDALKYLPGVQVQTPGGYRGGEYGYTQTHSVVTINGDARVIVLVDGRRMDNTSGSAVAANSGSGSKATVDINQIVGVDDIDKIEVMKGPGASAYGADATGGVINIITKKGTTKPHETLDFSMGSWKRYNYGFSMSGGNTAGNVKYFIAGRREMGGDSHYRDGLTDKNYTWHQTGYRDNSVNARFDFMLDKKDPNKYLTIAYNHMDGNDDYPLTAPYYKYLNETDWTRIKNDYKNNKYGDPKNPGYRNLWIMWLGAYNRYNKNNYDVTYNFKKDHGMDSFIRFYDQRETYWGSFGGGDSDLSAPVPFTDEWNEWAKTHYKGRDHKSWWHHLNNRGFEFQYAKAVGKHDLITEWTYDKSHYLNRRANLKDITSSRVERESVLGYIQDKIHINKRWEITPAIRYSHYSDMAQSSSTGTSSHAGSSTNTFTPSISTQFAIDDTSSIYASYSEVYRPLRVGDYTRNNGKINAGLKNEKGDVWAFGYRKHWGDTDSFSIHYDYTRMSNAVNRYSIWDPSAQDFNLKYINAKETKKSFNMTASHKFDSHWTLSANYSHALDHWKAKNGMEFDPDLSWADGNVNSVINKLRPQNTYTAILTYDNGKFNTSLLCNYYTGLNRMAYTSNRFLVMDWTANYDINSNWSVYGSVTNLTNEAWENTYTAYLGMGAWPQPGRAFMIGTKYKF